MPATDSRGSEESDFGPVSTLHGIFGIYHEHVEPSDSVYTSCTRLVWFYGDVESYARGSSADYAFVL
jgi:hypothetical protein